MKKIFAFVFSFLFVMTIHAQNKLTLDKAISIALQRNSNLIKAKNNLRGSESQLKSAYGNLFPNLSVSGSWGWNRISDDGGKQIDFFGRPTVIPPSQVDSRNYRVSAGGGWTLFDGLANISNVKSAKFNLKAARLQLLKQKEDVVLKTTQLYYAVLSAEELLKVRKENLAYNKKQLETIEAQFSLGAVAKADLLAQRVQTGNAQLQLIQAENEYEKAKSNLLNYLALDVLEDYTFENPHAKGKTADTSFLKEFEDVSKMVEVALRNRPDFLSQKFVYESRLAGITAAKGGLFPRLSGNFSFGTSATDPNDLFHRRVYSVGLSLNLPIFSNFNTERQIEMAKINALNAQEDLEILKRQIKTEIKQGYLDLIAAKKQLEVSIENVKSAQENRKINRERYALGSATILDLLQADKTLQQAIQNKISAEFEFYRLKENLLNVLGKLDVRKYENIK